MGGWTLTSCREWSFPASPRLPWRAEGFADRINCGGPAYGDYTADRRRLPAAEANPADTRDFYTDWAAHEFGPEAGPAAAAIFQKMDGVLPKPCTWVDGPGGIQPDRRPWEQVRKEYAFVDEFAALGSRVKARATGSVMITG